MASNQITKFIIPILKLRVQIQMWSVVPMALLHICSRMMLGMGWDKLAGTDVDEHIWQQPD